MPGDDELMIRIQSGDRASFDQLVERHQHALIGFFFRNTRDLQLAEDLAQETLLRVFNQAWDYLPLGRFRSWMFRVARNLLIDSIRRRTNDALIRAVKVRPDSDEDVLAQIADSIDSPLDRARYRELAQIVGYLLDQIPEEQRLTFTLHHYGGLPLSEVSEVMEATLPTTKSRLRLAREKLQELLRRHGIRGPEEFAEPSTNHPAPKSACG